MFIRDILIIISLYLRSLDAATSPHWNYEALGPDVWSDLYSTCDGLYQSPINIKTACTTYQEFAAFNFSSAYDLEQKFTLTNTGHTITAEQVNASAYPLILTGGGLSEPFTFVNFHLHWGENYKSGSEHQLNGEKYGGEIHFVHANANKTKYTVLGFFMESKGNVSAQSSDSSSHHRRKRHINRRKRDVLNTTKETTSEWEDYFQAGEKLEEETNKTEISLRLASLMGNSLNKFYRYEGSLTTPPCSEFVIWTLFETPIEFNDTEIETFRTHISSKDYRTIQPLNNRTVYRNFPNATVSSVPDYSCCGKSANQTENNTNSSPDYIKSTFSMNQLLSIFILYFIFK